MRLHAMLLAGEAVDRELSSRTKVFVIPGNVDEVRSVEAAKLFYQTLLSTTVASASPNVVTHSNILKEAARWFSRNISAVRSPDVHRTGPRPGRRHLRLQGKCQRSSAAALLPKRIGL